MWLRYCFLAAEQNMAIAPSFRSRMTTFKEHMASYVEDVYDFVLLRDQAVSERHIVLVPIKSNPTIPIFQLLLPQLLVYLEEKDNELKQSLEKSVQKNKEEDFLKLLDRVSSDRFLTALYCFIAIKKEKNPSLEYWWRYMEMVCILLLFIRAQGCLDLHIFAFQKMLLFFHRYDHTNYARWGAVFLAQIKQLPVEVQIEFDKGNWVVKGSS